MTEKEAIEELVDMANALQIIPNTPKGNALRMALKALEREPILDKIRAEIEFIPTIEWKDDGTTYILASYFKKQVLEIIDKYKAESENKE